MEQFEEIMEPRWNHCEKVQYDGGNGEEGIYDIADVEMVRNID